MSIQFIDAQVTVKLEAEPTEDLTVTFISNAAQPAQRVANNSGFTFFNFTMGSVQVRGVAYRPVTPPNFVVTGGRSAVLQNALVGTAPEFQVLDQNGQFVTTIDLA